MFDSSEFVKDSERTAETATLAIRGSWEVTGPFFVSFFELVLRLLNGFPAKSSIGFHRLRQLRLWFTEQGNKNENVHD